MQEYKWIKRIGPVDDDRVGLGKVEGFDAVIENTQGRDKSSRLCQLTSINLRGLGSMYRLKDLGTPPTQKYFLKCKPKFD